MNRMPNPNYQSLNNNPVESAENQNDQMEVIEYYNAETKVILEKFILVLIAIGLVVGAVLSVGVVYILDQTGLTTPPSQQQIDFRK